MILVDTSVWVDHLAGFDPLLQRLLEDGEVLNHPFVTGEIALGNLRHRSRTLTLLATLPTAEVVDDRTVVSLIADKNLFGTGIGYVDAHLVATAVLTQDTRLWTRDRRLHNVAERLAVAHVPRQH